MTNKLCPCPERKCGSLATPFIIEVVTEMIGTSTFQEIKEWVIQRVEWRRQQQAEYDKGVKPYNVEKMLTQIRDCTTKGELLNLLKNKANAYHSVIVESQSNLQELNDDVPFEE